MDSSEAGEITITWARNYSPVVLSLASLEHRSADPMHSDQRFMNGCRLLACVYKEFTRFRWIWKDLKRWWDISISGIFFLDGLLRSAWIYLHLSQWWGAAAQRIKVRDAEFSLFESFFLVNLSGTPVMFGKIRWRWSGWFLSKNNIFFFF